jgi:hypothetical protein
MAKKDVDVGRISLVTSEDTYSSQTAQAKESSRRLKSFVPALDGILVRENVQPVFATGISDAIYNIAEFDHNDANGAVTRFYFAATATALYKYTAGTWNAVAGITFAGVAVFVTLNNLLHVSDGVSNFIFDGTTWLASGFPIPLSTAVLDVTAAGTLNVTTNRYYWFTFADQTDGRIHESSTSPISLGTGALVNKTSKVYPYPGTVATTVGLTAVVGTGTKFLSLYSNKYDKVLYADLGAGVVAVGTIANVSDDTHLTLNAAASATVAGQHYMIAPSRTTHWHLYASEAENSKVGQYLASIAIGIVSYSDQSPFLGDPASLFQPVQRPLRNDPPIASGLQEIFKSRVFRRRETRPNFMLFSAGDEVSSGLNGSPFESYPGTDSGTISDIVNEDSYPVESNRIRALVSHGDALYVGTEVQCLPWFGDDITDFAFSQVAAFNEGIAGRFAMLSTSHGLIFMSYSRKIYIFPNLYAFSYVPKDVEVTEQLVELSKPLRKTFEQINAADLDNVRLTYYSFGRRDWLIVSYKDINNIYRAWVYDFEIKAWFELQRGFTAVSAIEISAGNVILVGGTSSGATYVIDDLTGTYNMTGSYPATIWRTALQDLDAPENYKTFGYLELELTTTAAAKDITINLYFDPADADNPTSPQKLNLKPVRGSNKYRAFLPGKSGIFQRVMVETIFASSTTLGGIRTMRMHAKVETSLMEKIG